MEDNILDKGAEATIRKEKNMIVKDRVKKSYRLDQIDEKLRKFRTRREARVLDKLEEINFPAPRLQDMCDKAMQLRMEMVNGNKLRDVLYQNPVVLSEEMGRKIGVMHSKDIIHGDLTTSNMILEHEIKFIDFGLSFFSNKEEDKAVDLHLLRQALESKHYQNWEDCFEAALRGYKQGNPDADVVLKRLEKVESRGRNKNKH
ncbi:Kae1-associated serine/threonine protein kinase [Candidatus Woesearchaeota archaeon]|nr:Kae1-associated serine/threonine protein kinase [Candidatus Woesearchaeota archaeon]